MKFYHREEAYYIFIYKEGSQVSYSSSVSNVVMEKIWSRLVLLSYNVIFVSHNQTLSVIMQLKDKYLSVRES